ncbi:DNA-binding LacI/PurR family transcriptional regulator [Anaerotaenia torta]|uniref:LacI family DNA-binding transcriptional regulator n=1 Tax=Anaerotaenia torta TaxID=433293 RepID=UPI003D1F8C52
MIIDDIAQQLGVSKTTVSRAINGTGRLSEATRQRVLNYIKEIGFTPNAAAKNLATTKTHNIAYAMPLNRDSTRSSYFLECLFGVCKTASATLYNVFVVGDDFEAVSQIASSRKADGIILSRNKIGEANMEKLASTGIPIVLTGSTKVPGVIQISYDARAAFRDLTLRLMGRWSGDFGLILTQTDYPANITRADGFTDAHIIKDKQTMIMGNADTEEEILEAFNKLYQRGIRNIICGDDAVCVTLLSIIKAYDSFDASYSPGKSGHDGINVASFHGSHHLTTFHPEIPLVELAPERLGSLGCKILIHKIEGNDVPAETLLDYNLKI